MSISAASPVTSSAAESETELDSLPTNPLGAPPPPPLVADASQAFELLPEEEDFDFHDTIPAPPWLDETIEASDPTLD